MKKTHNVYGGIRKSASRRRKQLALALCVSLWLAGGSVAGAANLYLDANDDITPASGYPAQATVEKPAGTEKTLSVTGGNWQHSSGWYIFGGKSDSQSLDGYTLTLDHATNVREAFGARSESGNVGTATKNVLIITNGAIVTEKAYGGYSETGNVENNEVAVTKSAVGSGSRPGFVYGGYVLSGTGNATGNKVTVTDCTDTFRFSGHVYGGYVEHGTGNATGNEATVINSTVFGGVYGGFSKSGSALGNIVEITGGSTVSNNVYGGQVLGGAGGATDNRVTITNSEVEKTVYGGEVGSSTGSATNNTVMLKDGAQVSNVYGGRSDSTGDVVTGNTLNLSGAGNTVGGEVQNFATVNITDVTCDKPVLTLTSTYVNQGIVLNGDDSKTKIDASKLKFAKPETFVNGATMNLIKCENAATITADLAAPTTTQAYDLTPVTGVTINAALNGNLELTNTALTYTATENKASKLTFTDVEWKDSDALMNHATDATKNIDFDGAAVDVTKLAFTTPEARSAGDAMTLIANAGALANPENTVSQSYALNPVDGLSIDAALNGSVALSGNDLTYSVTSNKANKLTFGDVEWKDSGALLDHAATLTNVSFDGADVDTTNISFKNLTDLKYDKQMTLVSSFGDAVGTITGDTYKVGTTLEGKGKASLVDSDGDGKKDALVFTTEKKGGGGGQGGDGGNKDDSGLVTQEQTHNTVMGATVGMAALSAGNDFVGSATEGLSLASNIGADGVSSFAQMGGGSMRQETGSHVDTHTWNAILALGHQNKKERGTFEYGAFFEYGSGNYTTHNGDERGDGSMHYTGGGLLAKWTANHGLYVEGSLRAGSVHDDARNVLRDVQTRVPYSYETNAPYMGFHLGVGKEIPFDDIHALDVYGKYFYNRRNGVSFDAGGHYDLDAVTSQVIRVGARYNIKRDKWNFYAGAAYEHELDGKASGTADGVAIRGADTSGASFRGEIGATMKPGENSPWSLDLNIAGFAGKKQGFTGGVSVAFMF